MEKTEGERKRMAKVAKLFWRLGRRNEATVPKATRKCCEGRQARCGVSRTRGQTSFHSAPGCTLCPDRNSRTSKAQLRGGQSVQAGAGWVLFLPTRLAPLRARRPRLQGGGGSPADAGASGRRQKCGELAVGAQPGCPARFQHIVEDNRLVGWRYVDYGRNSALSSQVFLPEEVWHEKLPNPFDFWRGMPPLTVAATAAGTDRAASLFMKGIMENNGDVGRVIRTNEQLDPEQREQLLAALRERKRHAGNADRPVLLWAGAEVVTPKLASSDLQFLANRKFSVTEICAAFGVPEEIITTTNAAKYDVMAGARLNFVENRVLPLCRRLVWPTLLGMMGA